MRFLNKIVFIASANIDYSEVQVDGNIHFIGTQGVGKSTLLRALLFFYNADGLKLGIPSSGKKSFQDFYFPFHNSSIIYEMTRETGAFCIYLSRQHNRLYYRFIDSAYKSEFFVGPSGEILEWEQIQKNLKGIHYTKKIESFTQYKNIIYGNHSELGSEFRKYSLLESKAYENIPRAIQQVFLNSKVESEFIKDTIIKALGEQHEHLEINLTTYFTHLKEFNEHYEDIKSWTILDAQGKNPLFKLAEKITELEFILTQIQHEQQAFALELVQNALFFKNEIPVNQHKLSQFTTQIDEIEKKLKKLESSYLDKRDKINSRISVLKEDIKKCAQLSKKYTEFKIDDILNRHHQKDNFEAKKNNITQKLNLLQNQALEIKARFDQQIAQVNIFLSQFENLKNSQINEIQKNLSEWMQSTSIELTKDIKRIQEEYREPLQEAIAQKGVTLEAIQQKRIFQAELKNRQFLKVELQEKQSELEKVKEELSRQQHSLIKDEFELKHLQKQLDLDLKSSESELALQKSALELQCTPIQIQIQELEERLLGQESSLLTWLNDQIPLWQNHIGRVIDQDQLLLRTDLSPQKSNNLSQSFYGVDLDLSVLNENEKSIEDYQQQLQNLKDEFSSKQKQILDLSKAHISNQDSLRKKAAPLQKALNEQIRVSKYRIDHLAQNQQKILLEHSNLLKDAENDKKQTVSKIEFEITEYEESLQVIQNKIDQLEMSQKKAEIAKQKDYDRSLVLAKQKASEEKQSFEQEIKQQKQISLAEIENLNQQKHTAFAEQGLDVAQIQKLDKELDLLQKDLDLIEKNMPFVVEYFKDKREYLDILPSFKEEKATLEFQLQKEEQKYNELQRSEWNTLNNLRLDKNHIETQIILISKDLERYANFIQTEVFLALEDSILEPKKLTKSTDSCENLIEKINIKSSLYARKYNDFTEYSQKLANQLSPQNRFYFKTHLQSKADFFEFSKQLKSFIEEGKLTDLLARVNEEFAGIIRKFGSDTKILLEKRGAIEKIVSQINSDFKAKNFAGVIKSIELRVVESDHLIVQTLKEIMLFNEEHQYSLGELNLFSTSENSQKKHNEKAIQLLSQLVDQIQRIKSQWIYVADSFNLEFKVIENDNDTKWVQNLANVGSDGTDILVKSMINIMLLNVFKEGATKNKFKDFKLHCMMDEIGKLHPSNIKGILKFANDRNIYLINSSPHPFEVQAYRHTYRLKKNDKNKTLISRIVSLAHTTSANTLDSAK